MSSITSLSTTDSLDNSPLCDKEEEIRAKIFCKRINPDETLQRYTAQQNSYSRCMIAATEKFTEMINKIRKNYPPSAFKIFYYAIAVNQYKIAQELKFPDGRLFGILRCYETYSTTSGEYYGQILDMLENRKTTETINTSEEKREYITDEKGNVQKKISKFFYKKRLINECRYDDNEGIILHCKMEQFPFIFKECTKRFYKLLKMEIDTEKKREEFFIVLADFHYLLSTGCIFMRGSGSITEIAIACMLQHKGLFNQMGPWKSPPDLLALTRTMTEFRNEYLSYRA